MSLQELEKLNRRLSEEYIQLRIESEINSTKTLLRARTIPSSSKKIKSYAYINDLYQEILKQYFVLEPLLLQFQVMGLIKAPENERKIEKLINQGVISKLEDLKRQLKNE